MSANRYMEKTCLMYVFVFFVAGVTVTIARDTEIYPIGQLMTGYKVRSSYSFTFPSVSFAWCVDRCTMPFPRCYGFDFKANLNDGGNGACRLIYTKNEECIDLYETGDENDLHLRTEPCVGAKSALPSFQSLAAIANGYSRQKRQTQQVCTTTTQIYLMYRGLPGGGGTTLFTLNNPNTPSTACLNACTGSSSCRYVDFNGISLTCSLMRGIGSVTLNLAITSRFLFVKNGCRAATTTTTTTTTAPTTTAPSYLTKIIADDGICPAPLMKFYSSRVLGGIKLPGISTVGACKGLCAGNTTCWGVDFNNQTNGCYFHSMTGVFEQNVASASCCVHFRKTNCTTSRCYMASASNVAFMSVAATSNILVPSTTPTGIPTQVCPSGLCRLDYTLDTTTVTAITESVTRGCEITRRLPTRGCSLTQSGSVFSFSCTCLGDRCNSMTATAMAARISYYPMDFTRDDYGGHFRRAIANNIEYSTIDAMKNAAAKFNGVNSYFQINSYSGIQLGVVNLTDTAGNTNQATAGFAAAMWLKRTSTSGEETILSNGARGVAPVEIYSTVTSAGLMMLTATVRVQQDNTSITTLTATATTTLNAWHFVVTELSVLTTTTLSLSIFIGDISTPITVTPAGTITQTVPSPQTPIQVTLTPMCIGKQFVTSTFPISITDYYTGYMDEVWFFTQGNLGIGVYNSIIDQAKPL